MKKVLVVDDNPTNRKVAREALSMAAYEVLEAESGETSIAKAKESRPDIILMNIQMPGVDGVAAMKIIRKLPSFEKTPIIALTAFAMKGDREKLLNEGFSDYISKPLSVPDLLKMLDSL